MDHMRQELQSILDALMAWRKHQCVSLLVLWGACLLGVMGVGVAQARPLLFAYVAWWTPSLWQTQSLGQVDRLKFIEFKVGADGRVADRHGWPERWSDLRAAASRHGVPLDIVFTVLDPAVFESVFGSAAAVARLQSEVLAAAAEAGVSGIHLDVELQQPASPRAVTRYRAWVAQTAARLGQMQPQRLLSVFLASSVEPHLYDASTLALVDHVIVQGYDAHWVGGQRAGPVAPLRGPDALSWEQMAGLAMRLEVPPGKLLMGFPLFGYEWPVSPCEPRGLRRGMGETTTFAPVVEAGMPQIRFNVRDRVQAHGATHDPQTGSAYYVVPEGEGHCRVGWFEDWWTLQAKLDWVRERQMAGVAFFPLGYDQAELVGWAAQQLRKPQLPKVTK